MTSNIRTLLTIIIVASVWVMFYYFGLSNNGVHRIYRVITSHDATSVANKAIKRADMSLCENIRLSLVAKVVGLGPNEIEMKDTCYYTYADALNEQVACSRMRYRSDSCYERVASHTQNVSLCYTIQSPLIKGTCVADIAKTLGDTSLCETLTDPSSKSTCRIFSKPK